MGAGLLAHSSSVFAERGPEEHSGRLTPGDAALLRFAAAAEILETDFWVQYNELGGVQDSEVHEEPKSKNARVFDTTPRTRQPGQNRAWHSTANNAMFVTVRSPAPLPSKWSASLADADVCRSQYGECEHARRRGVSLSGTC